MFSLQKKILIVDDMNMFRSMVRQALQALDFKTFVEASDGSAAFGILTQAHADNAPFQLVISDWNMPKLKGIDLLRKVRAESWGAKLPFIMLTAEAEKANIVEAVQAGVDNYIIKPFTIDQMKVKLQQTYDKVSKNTDKAS